MVCCGAPSYVRAQRTATWALDPVPSTVHPAIDVGAYDHVAFVSLGIANSSSAAVLVRQTVQGRVAFPLVVCTDWSCFVPLRRVVPVKR